MASDISLVPLSSITNYQSIPETKENLEWADLIALDLSKFDTPEGKRELAAQLKHAIHTIGFFYVTNTGLTPAQVDAQFQLAVDTFRLPLDEKQKYAVDPSLPGGPLGYKAAGTREVRGGLRDNVEIYDDPKYNSHFTERARPQPVRDMATENETFCRQIHASVLYKLLVLSTIILELPDEEALWKMHDYDLMSNCHVRYMVQHPRAADELETLKKAGNETYIYGHTDFGTFTLLFRQPIAALQVRLDEPGREGQWKWVKPLDGGIVVNVADTLSFLTGGYLKSSIHRVVLPPEDQRMYPRVGVIYFSRPDDETALQPVQSPVIAREGNVVKLPEGNLRTAGDWVQARYNNIPASSKERFERRNLIGGIHVPAYA